MSIINEFQKPFSKRVTQEVWDNIWKNQADGFIGETKDDSAASNSTTGNSQTTKE